MGFYYAKEKARFDRMWVRLRKEYKAAGMNDEAIQSLYEFDCQWLRNQRTYMIHTQPFPSSLLQETESRGHNSMFSKFDALSVSIEMELWRDRRHDWIETVTDAQLTKALKELSEKDIELLTLLAIEGFNQSEIAAKWGCSQKAISKRYQKIKNFLRIRF